MKFIKFHPEGFSSCIVKLDEVSEILDEDCQAGDKIILEVLEMTEEEYLKLPEFEGF